MERIIDFKTTRNDNEKTVEAFLKEHGFTHQVLVNLKKTNNGITRNGIWAYTNEKICSRRGGYTGAYFNRHYRAYQGSFIV